jgi:hypothetical protein
LFDGCGIRRADQQKRDGGYWNHEKAGHLGGERITMSTAF